MTSWLDTASLLDLNVYGSGRQGFDEKSHRLHESYHEPVIDREHIRHFGYTHSRTQRRAWATPEKFKVQHDEKRVQGIPLDSLALRNNSIATAVASTSCSRADILFELLKVPVLFFGRVFHCATADSSASTYCGFLVAATNVQ